METYSLEVVNSSEVRFFSIEARNKEELKLKINEFRQKIKNTINPKTGRNFVFPVRDSIGNKIVVGDIFFKSLRKV